MTDDAYRCRDCDALLEAGPTCTSCDQEMPPPYTVTDRLRWLRASEGLSMLEALDELCSSASWRGHTLYSGAFHPIPESSYRRRTGGPSDIRS